jgi:hypothetical protein
MKKTTIILVTILLFASLWADFREIDLPTGKNEITVVRSDIEVLKVQFSYDKLQTMTVETERGKFNELFIPKAYSIGELGAPKLPAFKKLIEIPFGADVQIKSVTYHENHFRLTDFAIGNQIFPMQPTLPKNTDMNRVGFEYSEKAYTQNRYIEHDLVTVEILGAMRGVRIARLTVAPVYYNPTQNEIRVLNDIEVELSFTNVDKKENERIKKSTYSPYFEAVYDKLLNRISDRHDYPSHPDLVKYPVKYLIVSTRTFESTLQPFIEWKTKKGFDVIVGYTDVIGSSVNNIKTWIQNHYNAGTPENPAPSFVLFVGDVAQIPASATGSSTSRVTDLYYCSTDGDMFPEMYWGRFSATSVAELQPIINKTLYYEQYQFADPTYLDNVTLIAGVDASWNPNVGQPTVHYGTQNYFNSAHGFNQVNTYLTSYTGCYTTINTGVGFINYTAHGSETSWADPSLTVTGVHALTNVNKPTFAVGNCCVTGDFSIGQCFGESWTRATNGGVGYIGSAPNTYWFEDFYWSVGAFPIVGNNNGYVPTYAETALGAYDAPFHSNYVTMDAIKFVGNLTVTEANLQGYPQHSSPLYYWQAYSLFGDPSLVAHLTQGDVNVVSFEPLLPLGTTSFTVNAVAGSYVAISMNGVLHGAALVDASGSVAVPITAFTASGTADIVVTKPQFQPEIMTVTVAPLSGPYVSVFSTLVSAGGDTVIEYGETVYLTVTLKNVGTEAANNVNMTISESDAYVTLNDSSESFGNIAAGASVTRTSAFQWTMANNVPNEHAFTINSSITCTGDSWTPSMNFTAYRPNINVSQVTISDGGNGRLDPGETANIVVTLQNSGGAQANSVQAILSTGSSYITINTNSGSIAQLAAGSSNTITFNVTASPGTPIGHNASFSVAITAHNSYSNTSSFNQIVGLNLEDFETGNFNAFAWTNGGNLPWTITNVSPYQGVYSAKSGAITHNQTTSLILTANVTANGTISFYKKVSSESGYDFLRFYIDDVQQGQWAGTVAWSQETYAVTAGNHTFRWTYSKDGSVSSGDDCAWIDYIVFPSFGAPAPSFSVSPASLSYGNVYVGQSSTKTFTITNSGNATMTGNITTPLAYTVAIRNTRDERDKKEEYRNTISYNIAANSSQVYNLTFVPATAASYNGNVVITSNDANHPSTNLAVTGAGIYPPAAVITPTTISQSVQPEATASQNLNIQNTGGQNLTYSADFTYVTRNRATILSENFNASTNLPAGWQIVDNQGNGQVWQIGTHTSGLGGTPGNYAYLNSDAYGSGNTQNSDFITPTLNLSNYTGVTLEFTHYFRSWSGSSGTLSYSINGGSTWVQIQQWTATTSNPASFNQAISAVAGQSNVKFKWNYTGTWGYYWDVDNIVISGEPVGPSYTWLSLNGQPSVSGTVTPSNNVNIPVNFNAAGLTLGTYQAQINVTTNDPNHASTQIPVTLTVSSGGIPQISVNPATINYGDVEIGSTSSQQFTITNAGTGVLTGSITTPGGYTVENVTKELTADSKQINTTKDERNVLNFSVNASSYKSFNLIFHPLTEQAYNGNVTITNNATSDVLISVTGTGIPAPAPEIVVNPGSFSVTIDTNETNTRNLTVQNVGQAILNYSANISYNPPSAKSAKAYCATNYTNTEDDWISKVQFNTINNSSGSVGYEDFTGISTEVIPGESYELIVDIQVEGSWTQHCWVWFDWNQNELFTDAGEAYDLGDNGGAAGAYQFSQIITIPLDALPGATRLRIAERYSVDPEPCTVATYGEAEDYTIVVVETNPMSWLSLNGSASFASSVNQGNQETITVGFDSDGLNYGVYTANIVFTSNDPSNPEEIISVTMNVEETSGPSWLPVIYPNNSATLYGLVTINDLVASAGDKVGAFVGSECRAVGEVVVNAGSAYVTLVIQLAQMNETVRFKVWDASAEIIYEAGNTTAASFGQTIGTPPNYFVIDAHDVYGQTVENEIVNLDPVVFEFDGSENVVIVTPPATGNPNGGELIITRMFTPPANMPDPDCVLPLWYNIDATYYTGGYPVTVTFEWDSPAPVSDEEPVLIFSTDNGETWLFADAENGVTILEWDLVNTDGDNYSVTFVSSHFSQWVMGDGSGSPITLPTPLNVTIQTSITEITINWQAVSGATSYLVYSSNNPHSGFLQDDSGIFNGTTWTAPFGRAFEKKFYYVKAVK